MTAEAAAPRFAPGSMAYLENYWVDVVSYSPKARNVRYRRLGEPHLRYMRRIQFERGARETSA
jgi:hypothetical protein